MDNKLPLGFLLEPRNLSIENLLPSRASPAGLASYRKIKQIRTSIADGGRIEPLTVSALDAEGEPDTSLLATAARSSVGFVAGRSV